MQRQFSPWDIAKICVVFISLLLFSFRDPSSHGNSGGKIVMSEIVFYIMSALLEL